MSDLLVVLGAGASHDALRDGFARPPLTAELFDDKYDDIQRHFPGVDGLRDTIRDRILQGRGLENVLGDLATNAARSVQRQLREIPLYLQALISTFANDNRAGTYDRLITLIQERGLTVTFVTLNYDTILDAAIARKYGISEGIASIDSYISELQYRQWDYIKLHGSANWGYRDRIFHIHPQRIRLDRMSRAEMLGDCLKYLDLFVFSDDYFSGPIEVLSVGDNSGCDELFSYPALAVPTDRKYRPVCPPSTCRPLRPPFDPTPQFSSSEIRD